MMGTNPHFACEQDELDMEVHESEHLRHPDCSSHGHPSAAGQGAVKSASA